MVLYSNRDLNGLCTKSISLSACATSSMVCSEKLNVLKQRRLRSLTVREKRMVNFKDSRRNVACAVSMIVYGLIIAASKLGTLKQGTADHSHFVYCKTYLQFLHHLRTGKEYHHNNLGNVADVNQKKQGPSTLLWTTSLLVGRGSDSFIYIHRLYWRGQIWVKESQQGLCNTAAFNFHEKLTMWLN